MIPARRWLLFGCLLAFAGRGGPACATDPPADGAFMSLMEDPRFAPPLIKALQSREEGDVDGALDHLRQANNAIKRAKGANHPDQLPVLDFAAEILFDTGRLDDAVAPLKRAVAIRESLVAGGNPGGHEVGIASGLLLMGRAHASTGRFESGLEALTRAVRLLDDALGPGHESTASARRELAEAVAIFEKTLGPDHPATHKAQQELVEVEVSVGDYQAAARLLEGLLAAARARSGPAAPAVVDLTTDLARAVHHAGRPEEAGQLLLAAVESIGEEAKAGASLAARLLRACAEIQLANDAPLDAEDSLGRALSLDTVHAETRGGSEILDRLMLLLAGGEDAPSQGAATSLEALAAFLVERAEGAENEAAAGLRVAARVALVRGDHGSAHGWARRALDIDGRTLRPSHPDTLTDRLLLGSSLLAGGDVKAAVETLEATHRAARAALGASHATSLEIAESIAVCHSRLGRHDDAEKVVLAMLSRNVPYAGRAIETRLVAAVDGVAAGLETAAAPQRAESLRATLVALRERQFGADDPRVAATLAAFGRLRLAERRWGDAAAFYERAVAVQERGLDPDHPEVAASLVALAKAYRAERRHEEARTALSRAAGIWGVVVGATHPITCETLKLLALTELALGRPQAALPLMERLLAAYDARPDADPGDVARLLMKMAEVRMDRGEIDVARNLVARALTLQSASDAVLTAVDIADFAKRNRLTDDDDAGLTIAGARQLADTSATRPAADAAAADAIREAWALHAGGQRDRARELLLERIALAERAGSSREPSTADLLVAFADMREAPLDVGAALPAYRRAAEIRRAACGDAHPATVAAALRIAGAEIAAGDPAAAGQALRFAAGQPPPAQDAVRSATAARETAGQTVAIAIAAGNVAMAVEAIRARANLCPDGDPEAIIAVLDDLAAPLVEERPADEARSLRAQMADRIDRGRFADPRCARAAALARTSLALAAGDPPLAEPLVRRLVADEERGLAAGDPRLIADLLRLAAIQDRLGTKGLADESRERGRAAVDALVRRLKAAGLDASADTDAFVDLARVLSAAGDADRAERVLKAAVESRAVGSGRPADVGRLLLELGTLRLPGRPALAARSFTEAERVLRDALGGGHGLAVAAGIHREQAEHASRTESVTSR